GDDLGGGYRRDRHGCDPDRLSAPGAVSRLGPRRDVPRVAHPHAEDHSLAVGLPSRSSSRAHGGSIQIPSRKRERGGVSSGALSHDVSPTADSFSRNCSGVSLRNSQTLKSGNLTPSRPYGV